MKKYYLITHANKDLQGREEILFEEAENLPAWTSRSPGFDTEEELRKHTNLPDWKCSKCGGEVTLTYCNNQQLIDHKMCFSCNHFREQAEKLKTNPCKFVIENHVYTVYPDNPNLLFKGFGGREFKIKPFNSDNIIITHNLWSQGEIPVAWRGDLPNTAEFVK